MKKLGLARKVCEDDRTGILSLPGEILEQIFLLLPRRDLMQVVLVCRWWREVGERPHFWSSSSITVSRMGELHMLMIRRLEFLEGVTVSGYWWDTPELEQLCRCLLMLPRLNTLSIRRHVNIANVDHGLFASIGDMLEVLDVNESELTTIQLEALFKKFSSRQKQLYIQGTNMKSVDPEKLATAINKLEWVNMYNCFLTNQQTELMFEQMSKATNLKRLRLSYNNLSSIDPAILGTQVSQLEMMHMEEVELTPPQVETLFMSINSCSMLTSLDISSNILATVLPSTLARALNRIADVNIANCALTAEQVETLFESINEATCMKDLSIALNNLSFIEGDSLARGVNLLRTVNMSCTNLTHIQAEKVMIEAGNKGTRLKFVCFDNDVMDQINPQIMEAAVARMKAIQGV